VFGLDLAETAANCMTALTPDRDPAALPPTMHDLSGATIAFDLDGTLVDTAPDLIGSLNVLLAEQALPALPLSSARIIVGRGARALIERGFMVAGAPLDEAATPGLVARFIAIYGERIAKESRPFEGVEAALDALAGAGARLAVCTNKPTGLSLALLEALGLSARFSAVIGADIAPAGKPDPRHLIAAIEAAGGRLERSVLVGDSIADVQAARAAGTPSIVVSFGYTEIAPADLGGDHLIDRFEQLPALAERLLARAR
jgi:phosphoglycolate phosphatase